jgi:hypothetical protein
LDPVWIALASALQTLRPMVLRQVKEIDRRKMIFRELASDEAAEALRRGGTDELRRWLNGKFPELSHA